MKTNRFWLLFFAVVILVIALLLWHRPSRRQIEPTQTTSFNVQSSNSTVSGNTSVVTQSISPKPYATNEMGSNQAVHLKLEEFVQTYNKSHNIPVEFYGQFIDQNGNPIAGVKMNVTIRQQYAVSAIERSSITKEIPLETTSAQDGRLAIRGEKGDSLHIDSIQKDGYLLSPKIEKTYEYVSSIEPFHFDPQNPVIIKMWKELPVKEQLIIGSHVFGIDSGNVYTLDLIQGKKFAGETAGDLRVTITRPTDAKPGNKYAWSVLIEAVNGGLVEAPSDDEFMYLAPASGYEPKFEVELNPNDADWKKEINKWFFVRSRDSQVYGRIQVTVYPIYNVHSAVELNYAINPNGSRNLQP
jgi:hypothetical protein